MTKLVFAKDSNHAGVLHRGKYQYTFQCKYATPPYIPFTVKRYVGGVVYMNCFMLSSLPCFPAFCRSAIPTSCYIFMFIFQSCDYIIENITFIFFHLFMSG